MKYNFREIFQSFLAATIVIFCLAYFFVYTFKLLPVDKDAASQVMSILNTTFALLVGFYFGSAMTSKVKDETIGSLTNAPLPPNSSVVKTETSVTKTENDK